jgi:peptidoglycan/xylan/chitin deacetylase (PgdA/CDA1 family)
MIELFPVGRRGSMEALICSLLAFLLQCPAPAVPPPAPVLLATPTPSPTTLSAPPTVTATPLPPTAPPSAPTLRLRLPPPENAPELVAGDRTSSLVALTFDAGAGARNTPPILDALKAAGLRVTMFLTGRWVEQNPDLVRRIVADGHELANHSYSHPSFTRLTPDAMVQEIERTEELVQQLTGHTTRPWFRPPFGARDARVLAVVRSLGYYSVYWTLDSGDWRTDYSAADVLNLVSTRASGGAIVVLHLDSPQTAQVLPQIIQRLQARGLQIVTLSQLFAE